MPTPTAAAAVEISSQLPASPNSGPGMTQIQVHSVQAGAGAYEGDMPGPLPDPSTSRTPLFLLWGPTRPPCPFPYFFLRRAGLGWGLAVLARFEDASRGRNWDLGRKALSYRILSSLPRTLPSPGGYLGQVPPNRGVVWVVEVGLPMLVLQPHPLWGEGGSGLPAELVSGEGKVPGNQSPA